MSKQVSLTPVFQDPMGAIPTDSATYYDFTQEGNLLFTARSTLFAEIIDISDPSAAVKLSTVPTASGCRSVRYINGHLYTMGRLGKYETQGSSALQQWDVSDPTTPVLVDEWLTGTVDYPALYSAMETDGTWIYISSQKTGVFKFRVGDIGAGPVDSNTTAATDDTLASAAGAGDNFITVVDNSFYEIGARIIIERDINASELTYVIAFVTGRTSTDTVDLDRVIGSAGSGLGNKVRTHEVGNEYETQGLTVHKGRLYLCSYIHGMTLMDASTMARLDDIPAYTIAPYTLRPWQCKARGDVLYVSSNVSSAAGDSTERGLLKLDISDPNSFGEWLNRAKLPDSELAVWNGSGDSPHLGIDELDGVVFYPNGAFGMAVYDDSLGGGQPRYLGNYGQLVAPDTIFATKVIKLGSDYYLVYGDGQQPTGVGNKNLYIDKIGITMATQKIYGEYRGGAVPAATSGISRTSGRSAGLGVTSLNTTEAQEVTQNVGVYIVGDNAGARDLRVEFFDVSGGDINVVQPVLAHTFSFGATPGPQWLIEPVAVQETLPAGIDLIPVAKMSSATGSINVGNWNDDTGETQTSADQPTFDSPYGGVNNTSHVAVFLETLVLGAPPYFAPHVQSQYAVACSLRKELYWAKKQCDSWRATGNQPLADAMETHFALWLDTKGYLTLPNVPPGYAPDGTFRFRQFNRGAVLDRAVRNAFGRASTSRYPWQAIAIRDAIGDQILQWLLDSGWTL